MPSLNMRMEEFQPGFRFSAFDAIILVAGGCATAYVMTIDRWAGIAIAFVTLHFFLFCNVLRMSRPLELAWAFLFATMAIATISFDLLSWPTVFAVSLASTLVLAAIEIRRLSYHGVGWRSLNPGLPEWWQRTRR